VANYNGDQADGLRRLFGRSQPRVVTFASGSTGVGKSVLVANVASLLARQGKDVLILDENTKNTTANYFGALARHDLLRVANGEKSLTDVLVTAAQGIRILPAAEAMRKLGVLSTQQQSVLVGSFAGLEHTPDVVLVDASLDHPLGFSPLGLARTIRSSSFPPPGFDYRGLRADQESQPGVRAQELPYSRQQGAQFRRGQGDLREYRQGGAQPGCGSTRVCRIRAAGRQLAPIDVSRSAGRRTFPRSAVIACLWFDRQCATELAAARQRNGRARAVCATAATLEPTN